MDDQDKAWSLVQDAILAFGSEVPDIEQARAALLTVLSEEAWKSYLPPLGRPCNYDDFAQWVKEKVPRGLDTTLENLFKIAEGDTRLRDALYEATHREHGGDRRSSSFNVNNINVERPVGTSQAQALRRLRKDRPDLHSRVLAGEISANWAMVEAKFRPRTLSVQVTRPESVAKALLKHMSADDIAKLIAVLIGKEMPADGP